MAKIPFGPNYDEMLDPGLVDPQIRARALKALDENELDPINLFNITWKDAANRRSQSSSAARPNGNPCQCGGVAGLRLSFRIP